MKSEDEILEFAEQQAKLFKEASDFLITAQEAMNELADTLHELKQL